MGEMPIDTSWDFRAADTKAYTHCYHNYPAMMIPQIARRLIDMYGTMATRLLDPYCGTGTSLVEANLKGINAFGIDLNPLACLIAKTKTLRINNDRLDSFIDEARDISLSRDFDASFSSLPFPDFKNIDFWFKEETKQSLALIKRFIDEINDKDIKRFFLVAFSETIRETSLTRNSEFKLYRMTPKQIDQFEPDVWGLFISKLDRNRKGLIDFSKKLNGNFASTRVFEENSADGIDKIEDTSIDLVVTSPPYGDSRTTVAYGQFSRLANQWLEFGDASQIDNKLMGGKPKKINLTGFSTLDKIVKYVQEKDARRARDVFSFYSEYIRSIGNVAKKIKPGGYVCYVVGNRRVKETLLPTDKITREIFEFLGFNYKTTHMRNIPNKRMPSKNSPTNEAGIKSATMTNEYIVVMQKHK